MIVSLKNSPGSSPHVMRFPQNGLGEISAHSQTLTACLRPAIELGA